MNLGFLDKLYKLEDNQIKNFEQRISRGFKLFTPLFYYLDQSNFPLHDKPQILKEEQVWHLIKNTNLKNNDGLKNLYLDYIILGDEQVIKTITVDQKIYIYNNSFISKYYKNKYKKEKINTPLAFSLEKKYIDFFNLMDSIEEKEKLTKKLNRLKIKKQKINKI